MLFSLELERGDNLVTNGDKHEEGSNGTEQRCEEAQRWKRINPRKERGEQGEVKATDRLDCCSARDEKNIRKRASVRKGQEKGKKGRRRVCMC